MSDLISRADAIEAIASRDETDGTVKVFTGQEINEILSVLPSAAIEVKSITIHNTGITFSYQKEGDSNEELNLSFGRNQSSP